MSHCNEMEACCEERRDAAVDPSKSAIREAESDSMAQPAQGTEEESEGLCGKEQAESESNSGDTACKRRRKLKKTNSWKMVRFQDPSTDDEVAERDSSAESLFPEYAMDRWTSSTFEELFMAEDWTDITDDRLLRKKVLASGDPRSPRPSWGQEVQVKMQCVLEDHTVVEKDSKLVFVIGEGDVTQVKKFKELYGLVK